MTISDAFPATVQGLEEGENPTENTIPEDDKEDKQRIHENMEHPSNRTLVRVLHLGGAKRRFTLPAAKHGCGACEAQKRPAGPIVSRSPNSFVFNDLSDLTCFLEHVGKAPGETLRNAYRNNWLRTRRLRSTDVDGF